MGAEGRLSFMNWASPLPISTTHEMGEFSCGKPELDNWLKTRAMKAEGRSARTYVVTESPNRVVAFYTLSAKSVRIEQIPNRLARNMPKDIPVILLGRMAVDENHKAKGLGQHLLRDAMLRSIAGAEIIGARALIVEAMDRQAAAFYQKLGFLQFPPDTMAFFMPLTTIADGISQVR
jgi:GNAT superfamily N-acetyltransferase